ncbi:hypothetical protein SAMN06265795_104237 [Noviherbaspirillum humi]|uniref:Uncharacterized protein n=1 Tax=Noviherbaspirillum humi TaxID=1688639 RepID=A0A239G5M6_9BURK|nr:hypothetical protein [Noviherbaspirillum humi]SNS63753.1 hypothetical protein SAMN06265795_104237 [Noviherbaspirillum humi]
MNILLTPQFHRPIARSGDRLIWVACPRPPTVVAAKAAHYRAWQAEERERLQAAGEAVLLVPISH